MSVERLSLEKLQHFLPFFVILNFLKLSSSVLSILQATSPPYKFNVDAKIWHPINNRLDRILHQHFWLVPTANTIIYVQYNSSCFLQQKRQKKRVKNRLSEYVQLLKQVVSFLSYVPNWIETLRLAPWGYFVIFNNFNKNNKLLMLDWLFVSWTDHGPSLSASCWLGWKTICHVV